MVGILSTSSQPKGLGRSLATSDLILVEARARHQWSGISLSQRTGWDIRLQLKAKIRCYIGLRVTYALLVSFGTCQHFRLYPSIHHSTHLLCIGVPSGLMGVPLAYKHRQQGLTPTYITTDHSILVTSTTADNQSWLL